MKIRFRTLSLLITFFITFNAHAKLCSEEQEMSSLQNITRIMQEMSKDEIYITNIMDLRQERIRIYITQVNRIEQTCSSPSIYRAIIKLYENINYPSVYLKYVLSNQRKDLEIKEYVVGDEWNRTHIGEDDTPDVEELKSSILITGLGIVNTAKKLTLKNVGTAFYLGKFEGEHLVATAAHVIDRENFNDMLFHFITGPKFSLKAKKLIFFSDDIDFAIVSIDIEDKESVLMETVSAVKLNFDKVAEEGTLLTTIGFGFFDNERLGVARYENSNDCQIIFGDDKVKKLDKVFSIATGCDASGGDSGSPIVDRNTGELIGVMTRIRTEKIGLTSKQLIEEKEENISSIWNDASFATSMKYIKRELEKEENSLIKSLLESNE
ncbi:trypsin-like peptidase domain protein [Bacteriovorax sp. BAL6_X]|uniref:S1 family peptidase n=1 Tax=Bacteriovorax sp. BAL6_X TaxID=1201290 RepID=UPI0003864DC6|nr:serine protease [Bacteriovorax sp. BAL6_X]EPZ51988.1 trypsin-like peptidase domain protein [Bacteriovorax sp. BAL6_X]